MPAITIRDGLNAEILSANPDVSTGFGKYLKGTGAALLAGTDVIGQLRTPLHLANAGESGLGLNWSSDVALGKGASALSISAGAQARIGVLNRAGMEVFDTTFVGPALKVAPGTALVSFTIHPSLGIAKQKTAGALTFGFSAGSEAEFTYFHPFDLLGDPMSVAAACKTVLEHFVIPNSVADLQQMRTLPDGAVACVSGHGEFQVGASVDVAAAFNPLASVDTLPQLGKLQVTTAASVSVGVSATVAGDYQIRVLKTGASVMKLSVHKMAGRSLEVSLDAKAGPGITLGERSLLDMLFSGPGGMPGATREELVAAGISSKQLDRIETAMAAGLSRKIELALAASLAVSKQHEAAFAYEIDLDAIDAAGSAALDAALNGDLSALNALEADGPAHGIRVLQSRTDDIRGKKLSWRLNLVGLINVLSMTELVRTGSIAHDEESGELVITDKISADRVGAITTGKQLRRLLYESTVMSLTYKAAGLDVNTDLNIDQSFFFLDRAANRQRVSDYLDAVEALGLIDEDDAEAQLGGEDEFGKASLLLETSFDHAACQRLFERPGGPPDQAFYEAIGRRALLTLVKPSEPDAYRRLPLTDDGLWAAMRSGGQAQFRFILPPPITGSDDTRSAVRVAVVAADYTVIVWWAAAMATAASRMAAMQAFLAGRDPIALDKDAEFTRKRRDLEEAMVKAIRSNKSTFDDPWGLIALHMTASGTATAAATLISPKLMLFLPDEDRGVFNRERALPRGTTARAIEGAAASALSAEDIGVLRRHVVNLRMGTLSTGGAFQSSPEDIAALFAEHLPAFLAEQRGKTPGVPLRLVFFAHGGLNDEIESLRNARKRISFYLDNGCYPVFFVWETGIKETLTDIVRNLAGFTGSRGIGDAISGATDPLLETAFRQGGFSMWRNMKRSAELAFLPKQGGTLVVQELASFWKQHSSEMEIHAIGHSAGSIFHAYFLSALCAQPSNPPIVIRSLHFLAPAITVDLFRDTLQDLVGGRVKSLTQFTMARDFELADAVGPYQKSLLYLVSRSFEDRAEMPILGLEESLRRDPEMIRFFGLFGKGQKRQAELLLAVREDGPSHSTIARKHGQFDNDRLTMAGVMRRILRVEDDEPIVEFSETVSDTVLEAVAVPAAAPRIP